MLGALILGSVLLLAADAANVNGNTDCTAAAVANTGDNLLIGAGDTADGAIDATGACGTNSLGAQATSFSNQAFWVWTATCTGTLTVNSCNALNMRDTVVAIYQQNTNLATSCTDALGSGLTNGALLQQCDDDAALECTSATSQKPQMPFNTIARAAVTQGTTYIVRIGGTADANNQDVNALLTCTAETVGTVWAHGAPVAPAACVDNLCSSLRITPQSTCTNTGCACVDGQPGVVPTATISTATLTSLRSMNNLRQLEATIPGNEQASSFQFATSAFTCASSSSSDKSLLLLLLLLLLILPLVCCCLLLLCCIRRKRQGPGVAFATFDQNTAGVAAPAALAGTMTCAPTFGHGAPTFGHGAPTFGHTAGEHFF
eukprot:NODE_1523_length_1385_cov_148.152695_g1266_i0.p1 GENE.NODE_1523_length_1385_cov_148.152695_g1266_i0~~NODE_1523_length_1385_cov_148.152695_g1266_i0.p1  ORF type:complete len:374 (+),score=69.21 NODE_1523_length_1385_cov_148.152695_g1266_i0:87-1208(+)